MVTSVTPGKQLIAQSSIYLEELRAIEARIDKSDSNYPIFTLPTELDALMHNIDQLAVKKLQGKEEIAFRENIVYSYLNLIRIRERMYELHSSQARSLLCELRQFAYTSTQEPYPHTLDKYKKNIAGIEKHNFCMTTKAYLDSAKQLIKGKEERISKENVELLTLSSSSTSSSSSCSSSSSSASSSLSFFTDNFFSEPYFSDKNTSETPPRKSDFKQRLPLDDVIMGEEENYPSEESDMEEGTPYIPEAIEALHNIFPNDCLNQNSSSISSSSSSTSITKL